MAMVDPVAAPPAEIGGSARAQDRFARTVGDFARLLRGEFRRHDPKDGDRPPLARAARLAGAHLGLKLAELVPADDEAAESFLDRFAAASGARIRRVTLSDLSELEGEGPIIGFAGPDRDPMVLLPRRIAGLAVLDPVTMRPAAARTRRTLDRVGYALHPVLPATKLSYRMLLGFGLAPSVPNLLCILACGVGESLCAMALPAGFAYVAAAIIPTDDSRLLWQVSAALLAALLLQTLLHVAAAFGRTQVEGRAGLALHAAMVDRVLRLPSSVLRTASTAILATQTETVDKFRRALIGYALTAVQALTAGCAAAALMCFYAPRAGLVGIGSVVVLLLVAALIGRLQFKAIYEGERMDVVVLTFVYDLIRPVPILQAQRIERPAFVQWAQNFLAFQSRIMRSTRIGNILTAAEAGWEGLTLCVCFAAVASQGFGAGLGAGGAVTTGAAVAFVVSLGKLNAAGLQAAHAISGVAKLMPMAKLARSLIEHVIMPQAAGAAVPKLDGRVTLRQVSFAYDTRPILSGVDLDIAPGEFVGLCGPSGGGKSTLLRLVLGLDQPGGGAVMVDGIDIRGLNPAALAQQIGVVLQNGQIWAGSIAENIRGATSLSLEKVERLAEDAGLGPELAGMPMGLQTIVGDGGIGLSHGQIQRILIARALGPAPAILVLDEPAGMLHGAARQRLLDTLASLPVTRLVVSHDPSLLQGASRIFRLAGGALTPLGAHGEPA